MWCDTVGCDRPSGPVRLQMHTGSSLVASRLTARTRAGSASALNSVAVASASSSLSDGAASGAQQTMGSAGIWTWSLASRSVNISMGIDMGKRSQHCAEIDSTSTPGTVQRAAKLGIVARKLTPLLCELHAHSTWSDGELDLRALVDLYGQSGFDVLCVTDHVLRT